MHSELQILSSGFLRICSSWKHRHSELQYARQIIVNNYSNTIYDGICNICMSKHFEKIERSDANNVINAYYKNIFTNFYKIGEDTMGNILNK